MKSRPTHDFSKKYYSLLYLHNWDKDGNIYPEIHGIYETLEEAQLDQRAMNNPNQYYLCSVFFLRSKEEE